MSAALRSLLPDSLHEAVAATPDDRDRVVDFLRGLAMIAVAVGHWLVMDVRLRPDGTLTGSNALEHLPEAHVLTWLFQVMPLFFLVGGFANARSLRSARRRGATSGEWVAGRLLRLTQPTVAFVAIWAGIVLLAQPLGLAAHPSFAEATRLVAVPLWFLAVYALVVAAAPLMLRLHDRRGWRVLGALVAGSVVIDAAVAAGVPLVGWLAYPVVWLAPQQAGFAWADGSLTRDRGRAVALAVAGVGALVALTVLGPYPVAMIGIPGAARSNTSPPTVVLLALTAAQLGIVLTVRDRLEAWLRSPVVWGAVVLANLRAMTIYLWHLTAAILVAVVALPTELLPTPPVGSAVWWTTRVVWILVAAAVLAPIVAAAGRLERGTTTPRPAPAPIAVAGATLGLVLVLAVLATNGMATAVGPFPVAVPAVAALVAIRSGTLAEREMGRTIARTDQGMGMRGRS